MKDLKTSEIVSLMLMVAIVTGAVTYLVSSPKAEPFGAQPIPPAVSIGNNITKTVTSTAVILFAKNPAAQLRNCTNRGADDLTLSPTTTNLTFGRGFVLKASSSFTWTGDALYQGDIYVIGTSTAGCLEI